MKRINIFRTGRHTSSGGTTLDFSDDVLRQAAEAYDPKVHEAPIVVGHPKDNGPAFGWIGGLEFLEGSVDALPAQVNEDFAELVSKGAYKKVSASWYAPDSPSNPVPGTYYLRHVGFLGAQPPAIKGLGGVEFSEGEEGIVEFSADWENAGIFRRLREFLIEKFGVEEADKAIPGYMVEGVEDAARAPKEAAPDYSESTDDPNEDSTMTEQELKDAQAKLEADQAALAAREATFAEQEQAATDAAKAARKQAIHARVDKLVTDGKIVPAQAEGIKSFAEKIDAETTVEFGEGDDATTTSALDFYLDGFEKAASGPDFGEHAPGSDDNSDQSMSAEQLAEKAHEYREERAKAGTTISYSAAVQAVLNK